MPHVPDTVPGKRVTDAGARTEGRGQPSNIRGGSRMQESCPYGSVRGAPSNGCPYRNQQIRSDLGTAGPSPITVDSLATRNWKFRIHFPPADSLSLSRSRFRRSRTRRSARVWAAGLAIGSAETLGFFDIAPIGGNISVGPNSSTAVRLKWWRDCHAGPNEVGPSLTYGRS